MYLKLKGRRTLFFIREVKRLSQNAPNCLHELSKYFRNNALGSVFEFFAESL